MKKSSRLNFSMIVGVTLTIAVFVVTVLHATETPGIYFNIEGLVIVMGGLFTTTFIMNPVNEIKGVFTTIFAIFKRDRWERVGIVKEIVHLAQVQSQDGFLPVNKGAEKETNAFFKEALELISVGLRPEDLKKVFELKIETNEGKAGSQAGLLLTLAKLGPGLGLVGTLVGMVSLLYQMGMGLGIDAIGPSMAVALCATFYGVAVSNLIFIPLAEVMIWSAEQEHHTARLVIEGVIMLKERRHPVHVRESLKAYLTPEEAAALAKVLSPGTIAAQSVGKGANVA